MSEAERERVNIWEYTASVLLGGILTTRAYLVLFLMIPVLIPLFAYAQPVAPIKHIVVIFQENHTFDNYFGTYPGANGLTGDIALPTSLGSITLVKPYHLTTPLRVDLPHDASSARKAYDGGKMDGFVYAGHSTVTMAYYDYRDIPYYWDYALRICSAR